VLVSFEGIDGAGKTTLVRIVEQLLSADGFSTVVVAQPGDSSAGREIKESFLSGTRLEPLMEFGLLLIDRSIMDIERVRPALAKGSIVLADRYWHSHVYQALAGLDLSHMIRVNRVAFPAPVLTFWIDTPVEVALRRAESRSETANTLIGSSIKALYGSLFDQGEMYRLDGLRSASELANIVVDEIGRCIP